MGPYVLFHANCDDGFGAAWAAWQQFGCKATYIPVKYDDPVPDLPVGCKMFILDFSYPRDALEWLAERCRVVVIDHHKTSRDDLQDLPFANFDMDRSGAGMAWDYFNLSQERPPLIDHIEDRDLWRFALDGTKQVSSGLRSYPMDFTVWDRLAYDTDRLRDEGVAIERYIQRLVENLAQDVRIETWPEGAVFVVNAPGQLTSELADHLIEAEGYQGDQVAFVAAYKDMADRRVWSLRSRGDFDVSAVAKARGGGGHKNAAGFTEKT
jgi:oligoribonuclease NrnB/cAMP/cGMP phosphodiesterase (DHH superfamily)